MDFSAAKSVRFWTTRRWPILVKRVFVLLLLLAVPVLTTLARNNWYLPQSNPGHYLTTASKTKVASRSLDTSRAQVRIRTIDDAVPPRPQAQRIRRTESAPPILLLADLSVSVQRRPPPPFLT